MNRRIVFRYSVCWLVAAAEFALTSAPTFSKAQGQSATVEPEANWGFPAQGFQISVAFAKPEFDAQEPVQAVVFIRNVSDQSLSYFSSGAQFLRFLVIDEAGRRVPTRSEVRSTPGQRALGPMINNPKRITLAPAEKFEERINLREFFDLPTGRYSVSATRTIPMIDDLFTHSEVQSGTATVAISAQNAAAAPGVQGSPELQSSSNGTAVVQVQPVQSDIEVSREQREIKAQLQTEAESNSVSKADVTDVLSLPAIVPWYEGKLVCAFVVLMLGAIFGFVVWRSRRKEPYVGILILVLGNGVLGSPFFLTNKNGTIRAIEKGPPGATAVYTISNGIALGLELAKTSVVAGERLTATMIVSNAGTVVANLPFTKGIGEGHDTEIGRFIVTDENATILRDTVPYYYTKTGIYGSRVDSLGPGSSKRFHADVVWRYSLTNAGNYLVKALAHIPLTNDGGRYVTFQAETPAIAITVTPRPTNMPPPQSLYPEVDRLSPEERQLLKNLESRKRKPSPK